METSEELRARIIAERTALGLRICVRYDDGSEAYFYPATAVKRDAWIAGFRAKGLTAGISTNQGNDLP